MADSNEQQLNWLREVLGVGAPSDATQMQQKFGFSFTEAVSFIGGKILSLFSDPVISKRAQEDLAYQKKALEEAKKIVDEEQRKAAVERIEKRLEEIKAHSDALETARLSVMGDSTMPPTDEQRSSIYAKALETHYGMKITIPKGMSNTHLDRVFDMMGAVPKAQADHDKAKKLEFLPDKGWKGSGAYNSAGIIKMGDFGDATYEEVYVVDGQKFPVNSFDVTMLHEMGHALDDKEGIMAAHRDKDGCGGWTSHSIDQVAAVMRDGFMNGLTAGSTVSADIALTIIKEALTKAIPEKPDQVEVGDWNALVNYVATNVVPSAGRSSPWFNPPPAIGGRCYLEAYSGQWWSYSHGAVAKTKVNSYQWRSPAEWFAEVYAISWLKRTKPPAGVDAAVASYMWQG